MSKTIEEEAKALAVEMLPQVLGIATGILNGSDPKTIPDSGGSVLDGAIAKALALESRLDDKIRARKEAHDLVMNALTKAAQVALRIAIGGLA